MSRSSKAPSHRRSQWSWIFYDWANSAFSTTVMAGFFPIFFKQYYGVGIPATVTTAKLGLANSIGSLLLGLTFPVLGAIADAGSYKKKLMLYFCGLGALLTMSLSWLNQGEWLWAIVIYVTGSLAHSASIAFYDSLLPDIAHDKEIDYVSAMGYAVGYLGGGLLFAVNVLMYLKPALFGISDGTTAIKISFISVGLWWLLFSIPAALWVREKGRAGSGSVMVNIRTGFSEIFLTLRKLRKYRSLLLFLAAFFLYNDGVGTTIKMAVDYGLSIGFGTSDLISALLLVQFVGFPAAIVFGKVTKHVHPKKAIYFALAVYGFVCFWAGRMQEPWEFYVLAILIGLVQGGVQSLSRSYYSRLIPKDRSGEFYGFYNLLGRFAGLIGPLLMGAVGLASGNPRMGILSISILFIAGGILLSKVHEDTALAEIQANH